MNRLITTQQVADYLKVDNSAAFLPHIDMAHALVAAHILTPTLDERQKTHTQTLKRDQSVILLRDGPVASVESITLNGVLQDLDDFIIGHWTIKKLDDERFAPGDVLAIAFTSGYRAPVLDSSGGDLGTVPEGVASALIIVAAGVNRTPNEDLVFEKIGDYTYQRATAIPGNINTDALDIKTVTLLAPFRRPRL